MTSSFPSILNLTEEHILSFFNNEGNTKLLFHDFRRASEIANLIQDIGNYSGYNTMAIETEIAKLSSWFYAIGKLKNYKSPYSDSIIQAEKFLRSNNYDEDKVIKVRKCIQSLQDIQVNTVESKLLHDAFLAYWTTSNNFRLAPLLRLEEELILGQKYTHEEWEQKLLDKQLQTHFYTSYGQLVFTPILNQNIIDQKKKVDNIILKKKGKKVIEEGVLRKYQGIEDKIPVRGTQTFFRSVYRNHINLSAIADNKANMMTGINAILISLFLSLLTYGALFSRIPMILMPIAVFVLSALVSLYFSVSAATPRVTKLNKNEKDLMKARKNIAFFGNFSNLTIDQFEEAMDAMLRNDELLYGNMSRDLYYLGKALNIKYKLLRISYIVFLAGFISSVLIFSVIAAFYF